MKKALIPVCVIIFLTFASCLLIFGEYNKSRKEERIRAQQEQTAENEIEAEAEDETEASTASQTLTAEITGILVVKSEAGKTMTFQEVDTMKRYMFEYDSTTGFFSKYGEAMSFEQLEVGEIYKAGYSIHTRKLNSVQVSDESFNITDVRRYDVDEKKRIFSIAEDSYQFPKEIVLISEDKEIEWMDITNLDTLTVRGIGRRVLSITVQKGHGYLRLKNDAYFVGGWIEVGTEVIKPITEDMLLPVPEGIYNVRMTNRGYAGEKKIQVIRDNETIIDLDDVNIEEVAIGHIFFTIIPDYAQLYIDNEITEFEDRVPLEYGVHKVRVECAGYETVTSNISVNSEYADISIALDTAVEETSSSSSSGAVVSKADTGSSSTAGTPLQITNATDAIISSSSASSSTSPASSGSSESDTVISATRKIYIEQPAGSEVYIDGNYIGIAPISTTKVTGSHVITLSRSGCETKSYTVNIENDGKDITLSFSELSPNQ